MPQTTGSISDDLVDARTLVALRQLVDPPDDCFEDVLVLGQSGRHLDETRRQEAVRQLRQSLEALDAARPARRRVYRAVLESALDAEQVDPRVWQRKPDLDVLARRLRGTPTARVVSGDDHLTALHGDAHRPLTRHSIKSQIPLR